MHETSKQLNDYNELCALDFEMNMAVGLEEQIQVGMKIPFVKNIRDGD